MSHLDGVDRHTAPARRLGEALRALQQQSGMTLRDLERRALVSDSSLSRYFRGSTVPPWTVVRDICRAMDTDPADFRALWEAADRTQNRPQPGPAAAAEPAAGAERAAVPGPAVQGRTGPPEPRPAPDEAPAEPPSRPPERPERPPASGRRRWTAAGFLAGLAAGVAGTLLLNAAPAPDPARVFRNKAAETCLDDSVEGLRSWPCNGLHYQEWELRPGGPGPGELRNRATGACLDNSGTAPRARSCNGSTHQDWTVTSRDDGTVQLRNLATGTCLEAGPAALAARTCDGSDRQRWT
ncbi:RICIN domain-containing protein [Streptomyces sp. 2P-4]|uniref:RICIN domain-containing protein n=1 Tax=Streptomyces sp. 2P-4 TaxID=2931974 RepID=UPI00254206B0|nr:RICIN domain-containing protein [Streptomyces sp. 2P-4]